MKIEKILTRRDEELIQELIRGQIIIEKTNHNKKIYCDLLAAWQQERSLRPLDPKKEMDRYNRQEKLF